MLVAAYNILYTCNNFFLQERNLNVTKHQVLVLGDHNYLPKIRKQKKIDTYL